MKTFLKFHSNLTFPFSYAAILLQEFSLIDKLIYISPLNRFCFSKFCVSTDILNSFRFPIKAGPFFLVAQISPALWSCSKLWKLKVSCLASDPLYSTFQSFGPLAYIVIHCLFILRNKIVYHMSPWLDHAYWKLKTWRSLISFTAHSTAQATLSCPPLHFISTF